MSTFKGGIITFQQVLSGVIAAFMAIIGFRWVWPVVEHIFDLQWNSPILRVASLLVFWLMTFFVLWGMVWISLFKRKEEEVSA